MRIGLHTSIAGSLEKAAHRAAEAGANTLQIFSSSPRQWARSVPDPRDVRRFRAAREKLDLEPLVIHDNYLINLAASNLELRAQSIHALRGEIELAMMLDAACLVVHPGNHKGFTLEEGIEAIVQSIAWAASGIDTGRLMLLLEITAGSGTQIGSRFEELAMLRDLVTPLTGLAIGYCLDTCHLLASGYEMATVEGVRKTFRMADAILGLGHVRVIHCNDSKGRRGSHVDRHQQIGRGHIGETGFRAMLRLPALRDKAFILETPHDEAGDEARNVEALRRLSGSRPAAVGQARTGETHAVARKRGRGFEPRPFAAGTAWPPRRLSRWRAFEARSRRATGSRRSPE